MCTRALATRADLKADAILPVPQCGKSTTVGLVERFYDTLSGIVTLDGVPLEDLNVASFRSQMSLVSQEPTLYRGSIRFNVL